MQPLLPVHGPQHQQFHHQQHPHALMHRLLLQQHHQSLLANATLFCCKLCLHALCCLHAVPAFPSALMVPGFCSIQTHKHQVLSKFGFKVTRTQLHAAISGCIVAVNHKICKPGGVYAATAPSWSPHVATAAPTAPAALMPRATPAPPRLLAAALPRRHPLHWAPPTMATPPQSPSLTAARCCCRCSR